MLFLSATETQLSSDTAKQIQACYFPYICGLHILLDYLIDQHEDRIGGDLNFCFYYDSIDETTERLRYIITQARNAAKQLEAPEFHNMIVEGLLALYLSDPKAKGQHDVQAVTKHLMKNSPVKRLFFWINSVWIRKKQGNG